MIQPPEGFEQSLRNYDPALSLRWGSAVQQWVIERSARISAGKVGFLRYAASRPDADPKAIEEYRSAQHSRHVIHYVKELDRRVHDYLWASDLQRKGAGPNSQVDSILRSFNRQVEDRKKKSHELARQTSDVLHWALKKNSSAIHAGKSDLLMREGFGLPQQKGPTFMPPKAPAPLLDAYGRAPGKKNVKLHTATR